MKQFLEKLGAPSGRKLTRLDRIVLVVLLFVYSLMAFVNLGTTVFPEKAWQGEYGETAIIDLGGMKRVSEIWFNGNIAEGTIEIYDDDDDYVEFEQDYGDMFKWESKTVSMETEYVRLLVSDGEAAFNEIALFDPNGERIDACVYVQEDTNGNDRFPSQQHLLDEQDTVPDRPSYLNGMYFDEIYHARTAYEVVRDTDLYFEGRSVGVKDFSYVQRNGYTIYEWTHPQLGKVLIALGIRLFGMNPFGWRFTGTLFGVLILWVLYILAKRIFRRTDFALLAAGLFAFDCMHYSQTRIATIDVYALFFTLLMFLFMLDYLDIARTEEPFWKKLIPLGLCGLAFGLGAASKWTCLYSGAGLAVLFFGSFILRCIDIFQDRRAKSHAGQKLRTSAIVALIVVFAIFFAAAIWLYFVAGIWAAAGSLAVIVVRCIYIPLRSMKKTELPEEKFSKAAINPIPALPVLYTIGTLGLYLVASKGSWENLTMQKIKYGMEWYDMFLAKEYWIPMVILVALSIASVFLFRMLWKGKDLDLRWNEQLQTLVLCCVFFIVVPIVIYYACSYSFYLSENRNTLYEQVKCLWDKQLSMYHYHAGLDATHPCQSAWYEWPLAEKSVWFYSGYPDGKLSNISSTGNPAVWYVSAFGAVLMAVEWCFSKERRTKGMSVVFVGILAGLLPWALVTRCVFLYHYFSALPFVVLAAVALLYGFEQKIPQLWPVKWIWFGFAALFFILMYPAISGTPCTWEYAGFIEHVLTLFGKVYYVDV